MSAARTSYEVVVTFPYRGHWVPAGKTLDLTELEAAQLRRLGRIKPAASTEATTTKTTKAKA